MDTDKANATDKVIQDEAAEVEEVEQEPKQDALIDDHHSMKEIKKQEAEIQAAISVLSTVSLADDDIAEKLKKEEEDNKSGDPSHNNDEVESPVRGEAHEEEMGQSDPFDFIDMPAPLPPPSRQPQMNHQGVAGAYAIQSVRFDAPRRHSPGDRPSGEANEPEMLAPLPEAQDNTGLVEAEPVDDEPAAVHFAQPFKSKKTILFHTWQLGVLLLIGLAFVAVVVVGSMCGTGFCGQDEEIQAIAKSTSSEVTSAHTTYFRDPLDAAAIQFEIQYALGRDYFSNNTGEGPHVAESRQKALHWILYEDPLQLDASDDRHLLQRFILVFLYYATTRDSEWTECNPNNGGSDFCYYPKKYAEVFNHPTSVFQIWGNRWLSESHECQWAGITCENQEKEISRIDMTGNNLNGHLPWELSQLEGLKWVRAGFNDLTGTIPTQLGLLTNAEILYLAFNRLEGTVPTELLYLQVEKDANPTSTFLTNNLLTGTLPENFRIQWNQVAFEYNLLSGSLPKELFSSSDLEYLDLSGNMITGSLPPVLPPQTMLRELYLSDMALSGTIPSELGLLTNLHDLHLKNNIKMNGTLPEELFHSLTDLTELDLSDSQFSGTISSSLGLLSKLMVFDVANNNFSGLLPVDVGSMTALFQVSIAGNNFSDKAIPDAWCALKRPTAAGYVHGQDGLGSWAMVADCAPDPATGVPAMACPATCCTTCCDTETNICYDQ